MFIQWSTMAIHLEFKIQNARVVLPQAVLFASTYSGLGGGETSLLELARHLDAARWTPHLLVPAEGQLSERWRAEGQPVHVLRWRAAMPFFVPALWARFPVVGLMAALLRREGFAAVHLDYHSMPLLAPACERVGIPWLWTVHGWWLRPKAWQRGLFRRAAYAFAVSEAAKRGFLQASPDAPPFMPPERIEVRWLGVDAARFHPGAGGAALRQELGLAPDALVVTMLGRFQPLKRHEDFLAMAARLAPAFPAARFLIAGENVLDGLQGDRYKARIHALAQGDLLLRQRVIFAGFRHDSERVLAASDVLVSASDFESFGMAHAEAMACAVPVVSTDRGGPAEIVVHGETGLLVPPRDFEALTDAVRRLLADPDLRARLGRAGRQRVEEHLAVEHYAARFGAVLERIAR